MKGWVGPRASRGVLEKRKFLLFLAGFEPRLVQPVQGIILTTLNWFTILRVPFVKRGKAFSFIYLILKLFMNFKSGKNNRVNPPEVFHAVEISKLV
jgi:hypothetical protein